VKSVLKKVIGVYFKHRAFTKLFMHFNRKKLLILCYHRVTEDNEAEDIRLKGMFVDIDLFDMQMAYIKRFYNVVSERDIISSVKNGSTLPDNAVWVTLDDGYKDNFTNAYSVLKKYKIPATIFVTTGFINKSATQCSDYIANAVKLTRKKNISFNFNGKEYAFSLDTADMKRKATMGLWEILRCHDHDINQKKSLLHVLIDILQVKITDIDNLFMTWDEIKEIGNNGIFIGAHTVSHGILSNLSDQQIEQEISESKEEIEQKINKQVYSLAYPVGRSTDFDSRCIDLADKSNFKLAVTAEKGLNAITSGKHFNLKRTCISNDDNLGFFKLKCCMLQVRKYL